MTEAEGAALETCHWTSDGDHYETSCDNAFAINDGGPAENGMKFCCYCGRALVEKP